VHKESKNRAEDYPVYIHRRSGEVRQPWTGFSGEANSDSLLRELHRGVHSLLRGLDGVGKGSAGRSTVAGARVAAGTPCTGQTQWFRAPVRSSVRGGVQSTPEGDLYARARAGDAGAAWRGTGRVGSGAGVLWHAQSASNTWRCSSAHVHKLAEIAYVRILAKIRRRPLPGTYGYLLYVSSKGR
jgi:hypothetical protein